MIAKAAFEFLTAIASVLGPYRIVAIRDALSSLNLIPTHKTPMSAEAWGRVLTYLFLCPAGTRATVAAWGKRMEAAWSEMEIQNRPVSVLQALLLDLKTADKVSWISFDQAAGVFMIFFNDGRPAEGYPKATPYEIDFEEGKVRQITIVPGALIKHIARDIKMTAIEQSISDEAQINVNR